MERGNERDYCPCCELSLHQHPVTCVYSERETPQRKQVSKPWLHPSFLRTVKTSLIWFTMWTLIHKSTASVIAAPMCGTFSGTKGFESSLKQEFHRNSRMMYPSHCMDNQSVLLKVAGDKKVTSAWQLGGFTARLERMLYYFCKHRKS